MIERHRSSVTEGVDGEDGSVGSPVAVAENRTLTVKTSARQRQKKVIHQEEVRRRSFLENRPRLVAGLFPVRHC